jgi:GNAT superfamily N-acetyltransferase
MGGEGIKKRIEIMVKIIKLSKGYLKKASLLLNDVFRYESGLPSVAFEASLDQEKFEQLNRGVKNKISSLEYFVAVDKSGRVLGTTGLYSQKKDEKEAYWLGWYCVDPAFRGKGIGGKLLDKVIRKAKERGKIFLRLYTSTSPEEKAAQHIYDSKGFITTRKEKNIIYKELKLL